jgi:hypothetical protein
VAREDESDRNLAALFVGSPQGRLGWEHEDLEERRLVEDRLAVLHLVERPNDGGPWRAEPVRKADGTGTKGDVGR